MVVIAIVGVLAGVALPAFSRYVKKARSAEAAGHLNRMWAGSVSYYEAEHMDGAAALPRQFPVVASEAVEQADGRCCLVAGGGGKCLGDAPVYRSDAGWIALSFNIPDAHNYVPQYVSAGVGTSAYFEARAWGDLDCDGTLAEFSRQGSVGPSGEVSSQFGMRVVNEIE